MPIKTIVGWIVRKQTCNSDDTNSADGNITSPQASKSYSLQLGLPCIRIRTLPALLCSVLGFHDSPPVPLTDAQCCAQCCRSEPLRP